MWHNGCIQSIGYLLTLKIMLTFRNSKIVYYGPHTCENCGINICKMGIEWGGTAFTYPDGPIYPNTELHPHVCDPDSVARKPRANPPSENHPPH